MAEYFNPPCDFEIVSRSCREETREASGKNRRKKTHSVYWPGRGLAVWPLSFYVIASPGRKNGSTSSRGMGVERLYNLQGPPFRGDTFREHFYGRGEPVNTLSRKHEVPITAQSMAIGVHLFRESRPPIVATGSDNCAEFDRAAWSLLDGRLSDESGVSNEFSKVYDSTDSIA